MSETKTIVFGTTADYIDLIDRRHPERCLFITDRGERVRSRYRPVDKRSELPADLDNFPGLIERVDAYGNETGTALSGIVAFDDESMLMAARLAEHFGWSYVSPAAVNHCRNKYLTHKLWSDAGLACPASELVGDLNEAAAFQAAHGPDVVIKPLTGSGSELTFLCRNRPELADAFRTIETRLAEHYNRRLFGTSGPECEIETYISGREYSTDFIIDHDSVRIIRLAGKVIDSDRPFGTTRAYIVPGDIPETIGTGDLEPLLKRAAESLGIERALCMADFIINNGIVYFLELAPRIGGDCLPFLIGHSGGLNMFELALDFANRMPITVPPSQQWQKLVGLRLLAGRAGTIAAIDDSTLRRDRRVREIYFKQGIGHRVVLPPDDYDSRVLGHVIFQPDSDDIDKECRELERELSVRMEEPQCLSKTGS